MNEEDVCSLCVQMFILLLHLHLFFILCLWWLVVLGLEFIKIINITKNNNIIQIIQLRNTRHNRHDETLSSPLIYIEQNNTTIKILIIYKTKLAEMPMWGIDKEGGKKKVGGK